MNKLDPNNIPREYQGVLDLLSEAPIEVRTMFWYAVALAMVDDEKAWFVGSRIEDGRELVAVKTIAGDVFEIVRPPISEEQEAEYMAEIRVIVDDAS